MKNSHYFHMVELSPWPIFVSICLFNEANFFIYWLNFKISWPMLINLIMLIFLASLWWRDIIRESTFQGFHTKQVVRGLKMGFLLFLISEAMFFVSLFWMFFHSALSPAMEIGAIWPPKGIQTFDPMGIPLFNTAVLVTSGFFLTWSHFALLASEFRQCVKASNYAIALGIIFSCAQMYEYYHAPFSISSSIYGASFFFMTGAHGMHVLVGTTFLIINCSRCYLRHFSCSHHLGFEMGAWYWHFVDVIWLLLYVALYWWGS